MPHSTDTAAKSDHARADIPDAVMAAYDSRPRRTAPVGSLGAASRVADGIWKPRRWRGGRSPLSLRAEPCAQLRRHGQHVGGVELRGAAEDQDARRQPA